MDFDFSDPEKSNSSSSPKKSFLLEKKEPKATPKTIEEELNIIPKSEDNVVDLEPEEESPIEKSITPPPPSRPTVSNQSGENGNYMPFIFKGDGKEFFKIWIVNVALTILTLGIYSAWAKVRTNRYLYSNTYLNNSNFEYNANPVKILIGRLVVVALYVGFYITSNILGLQIVSLVIAGIFLLILPWLIRQAVRFRLKSTSYRNINFKFYGTTFSFYKFFILSALVIVAPFILMYIFEKYGVIGWEFISLFIILFYILFGVLIYPIMYKKYKELIVNNSFYGTDKFTFSATNGNSIGMFFKIYGWSVLASVIFSVITYGGSILSSIVFGISVNFDDPSSMTGSAIGYILIGVYFILYISFIAFYKGTADGYFANFIRNNTILGHNTKLKGDIVPAKLGLISITNVFMLIFSLGLLYPWTKVRYLKYKIENTQFLCDNYDRFISDAKDDIHTYGEEATDFFDIDIGI